MGMKTKPVLAASVGAVAVCSIVAALLLVSGEDEASASACGAKFGLAGAEGFGGAIELVSETGETVTDKEIFTRPSLLYFGYTYCPDVCPIDSVRNADAVDVLKERGIDVQPVLVSLDWGRDDAEAMANYTQSLHPDMLGLSGSEAQIRATAKAYRVYFSIPDPTAEDYWIDHSTFSYFVVPGHGVVDFYKRELPPNELADRVQCILDNLSSPK